MDYLFEFLFGNQNASLFIAPALIAAGIGALASGATAVGRGAANRKSRKFQEKMWNKTNTYNSPLEQRKRLEKAGLNPNLVYGGSPGGTAGTASMPAKPDFDTVDFTGLGNNAMDFFMAQQTQSATDVNEARVEQIQQETVNAGLDAVNKSIKNASGTIDYQTKKRLYENTIKTAEANLANLSTRTNYMAGKNSREERVTDATIAKIKSETANLKTSGKKLSDEAIMTRLDRILYEDHKVRPTDPFYFKVIGRIMEAMDLKL